jgi:hypothetical protein
MFIADQAFSLSYDLAPSGRLSKRDNLLTGEGGEGRGKEPNHTTARKPDPLQYIKYSWTASNTSIGWQNLFLG